MIIADNSIAYNSCVAILCDSYVNMKMLAILVLHTLGISSYKSPFKLKMPIVCSIREFIKLL